MRPFRSVGARLALALGLVVAIALGVVYAIVVPSLERNLIQARIDELSEAGGLYVANNLPTFFQFELQDFVDSAAEDTNARVVYLQKLTEASPPFTVAADSRGLGTGSDITEDPIAREAVGPGFASGVAVRNGNRFAEAAIVVSFDGSVVLFSAPLEESLDSVDLVERRLLLAGGVALLVALLLGYGAASVFARRLRRLERATDRIAGGKLDEPVIDRGGDEVGQLARAFERMRLRLAHLEHARREFIANASHELRTPIFSLGGFLELLANEELDDETRREFLGTMQEQVERLKKLATDLLDLSRLDAGQLTVELEPLELPVLAGALAEEFAAVARSVAHPLEAVANGTLPAALGDEQRVLQIGRVLVENALRHTPAGTPVRIGVEADGGRVALVVEDLGPGIAGEHSEHVFERFYRVEGALASGSGLGLAIARELASLMGGTLELESRPGRTVFRLLLPAAAPVVPLAPEPALA
jgi:signal transduction histidine kinase